MSALAKRFTNGHAEAEAKCPVKEAAQAVIREAEELRDALRQRKAKRESNGTAP